jgi:hypothetical protein
MVPPSDQGYFSERIREHYVASPTPSVAVSGTPGDTGEKIGHNLQRSGNGAKGGRHQKGRSDTPLDEKQLVRAAFIRTVIRITYSIQVYDAIRAGLARPP